MYSILFWRTELITLQQSFNKTSSPSSNFCSPFVHLWGHDALPGAVRITLHATPDLESPSCNEYLIRPRARTGQMIFYFWQSAESSNYTRRQQQQQQQQAAAVSWEQGLLLKASTPRLYTITWIYTTNSLDCSALVNSCRVYSVLLQKMSIRVAQTNVQCKCKHHNVALNMTVQMAVFMSYVYTKDSGEPLAP